MEYPAPLILIRAQLVYGACARPISIPRSRVAPAYLTRPEIEALLGAADKKTWVGRRDHAMLLTAVQTGLRLSEITGLRQQHVSFGVGAHVRCEGKGRKERCTPLAKPEVAVLNAWIEEQGRGRRSSCSRMRGVNASALTLCNQNDP
jgi:integrase/recombinase XerD